MEPVDPNRTQQPLGVAQPAPLHPISTPSSVNLSAYDVGETRRTTRGPCTQRTISRLEGLKSCGTEAGRLAPSRPAAVADTASPAMEHVAAGLGPYSRSFRKYPQQHCWMCCNRCQTRLPYQHSNQRARLGKSARAAFFLPYSSCVFGLQKRHPHAAQLLGLDGPVISSSDLIPPMAGYVSTPVLAKILTSTCFG